MKFVQVGDIHIDEARAAEFEEMLIDLANSIISQNPDYIIFTGDLFIHRDRLTPNQVKLARNFFLSRLANIPKLMIIGNHDVSRSAEKADSVSAVFSHSDCHVYNVVGDHHDIGGYRFHMFPHPDKSQFEALGIKSISDIFGKEDLINIFDMSADKKNVLVFHGTLEGFNISDFKRASEEQIKVGDDLAISKSFWSKFDAVMAGHIHSFQFDGPVGYSGCPFPLTFADNGTTGYIVWDDLEHQFIALRSLYPFITYDLESFVHLSSGIQAEASRRLKTAHVEIPNSRVRVKYKILSTRSNELNHNKLAILLPEAKSIRFVPEYINKNEHKKAIKTEDFNYANIGDLIDTYVESKGYSDVVKQVASLIEKRISDGSNVSADSNIHFGVESVLISNFRSFPEDPTFVDFTTLKPIIGILGPNYSGKTSFIESIVWALYGTTFRSLTAKSIVRDGQTSCYVELVIKSNKLLYKILRSRNGNSGSLTLHYSDDKGKNWIDVSGSTARDTQNKLATIVGTLDIFASTVYSPQNKVAHLINKKPSERKQIIMDCLQVDVLEKRQEYVADLKREVKEKLSAHKGVLDAYSDEQVELVKSNPKDSIIEFNSKIEAVRLEKGTISAHLERLSSQRANYEDLRVKQDEVNRQLSKCRDKIGELATKISERKRQKDRYEALLANRSEIDEALALIASLEKKMSELSEKKNIKLSLENKISDIESLCKRIELEYKSKIKLISDQIKSVEITISNLKLIDCPKPDCPINSKINNQVNIERIKIDEAQEKIEGLKVECENKLNDQKVTLYSLQEQLGAVDYDELEYMEAMRLHQKKKKEDWEGLNAKLMSGDSIVQNVMEVIVAFESQKEQLVEQRDSLVAERSGIAEKLATEDRLATEINKARAQIAKLDDRLDLYKKNVHKCEQAIDRIDVLVSKCAEISELIDKAEEYLDACNKYAVIVGKDGLAYMLVDQSIPLIEKFAQDILGESTDGAISIKMENSREGATKGVVKDEVVINITNARGTRDVINSSGAELVMVSFALRAAMANLLSIKSGSKVELFILDEGFGALDDSSKLLVKRMITTLGDRFSRVMYITHVPELYSIAQSVISITTNDLVTKCVISEDV